LKILVRKSVFTWARLLWRKIQSLGLNKNLKKKSEIGKFFKLFFGLSFLKPEKVQKCFSEDPIVITPNYQQLHDFCNFFEKNYIVQSCTFLPSI